MLGGSVQTEHEPRAVCRTEAARGPPLPSQRSGMSVQSRPVSTPRDSRSVATPRRVKHFVKCTKAYFDKDGAALTVRAVLEIPCRTCGLSAVKVRAGLGGKPTNRAIAAATRVLENKVCGLW